MCPYFCKCHFIYMHPCVNMEQLCFVSCKIHFSYCLMETWTFKSLNSSSVAVKINQMLTTFTFFFLLEVKLHLLVTLIIPDHGSDQLRSH